MAVHVYKINPGKRKKSFMFNMSVTTQLIIANIILYFVGLTLLGVYGPEFLTAIALTPSLILAGKNVWTFLTSMFMHGSFFHIFANLFSLFFIGNFLEKIIGRKRFFWVYIISGLIGGGAYVLANMFMGDTSLPAVGASGAIFGLLGVLAVLVPFSRVYLIVGPLILIVVEVMGRVILPASIIPTFTLVINMLIFVMIFALFSFNPKIRKLAIPWELPMWVLPIIAIVPLTIISFYVPLPIGNSAHFGGLVVGLLYGWYLRKKFPNKTKRISHHFR